MAETKTFTVTATISRVDGGTVDMTNPSLLAVLEKMALEFATPHVDAFHDIQCSVVVT